MKQLLLFVVLAFLTVPVLGQQVLREIDLRVNGVGSGTPYSTVVRKFGKPLRSVTKRFKASEASSNSAETYLTLFYTGLEITLLGDGRGRNLEIYSTEVSSPKWLASGVKIGADARDVLTRFGEPSSKAEKSGETIFYYVTKDNLGGVNFHFKDDELIKVTMSETLC